MILHEFAVDPALFGTVAEFNAWSREFGAETGRLISKYPSDWKSKARNAIREQKPVKRSTLVDKLRRMDEKLLMLDLGRVPYHDSLRWVDNAREQNTIKLFHAIIVRQNPQKHSDVIVGEDIDWETPGFKVGNGAVIARSAEAMLEAVETILYKAARVVLVDKFFSPNDEDWLRPLRSFLLGALKGKELQENVEYHVSCAPRGASQEDFERSCHNILPDYVPAGMRIKVIRWDKLQGGDELHARLLLTDVCGVSFDWGLDEHKLGTTCNVQVLADKIYRKRLNEYKVPSPIFHHVDTTEIVGVMPVQ